MFILTTDSKFLMLRKIKIVTAVSALSLLTACGGGGGADETSDNTATFISKEPVASAPLSSSPTLPIRSAILNTLTTNSDQTYLISGQIGADIISGTGSYNRAFTLNSSVSLLDSNIPLLNPRINRTDVSKISDSLTVSYTIRGQNYNISTQTTTFIETAAPEILVATEEPSTGRQWLYASSTPLPVQATQGQSGAYFTANIYDRNGYFCGNAVSNWTSSKDSDTSIFFDIITTTSINSACSPYLTSTSKSKYRVTNTAATLIWSEGNVVPNVGTASLIQFYAQ